MVARRPAVGAAAPSQRPPPRSWQPPSELTALVVGEVGKPRSEARGEVARSVAILRYYAQQVFDPIGATHDAPGDSLHGDDAARAGSRA